MHSNILEISYKDILPFWKKLWPNREVYKPIVGMIYLGGFDKTIEKSSPIFYGYFLNGECVGVNSYFQTYNSFRSRGLYVEPEHRKKGIGVELLNYIKEDIVWSIPRKESLTTYLKSNFMQTTDFVMMDFGENCYAIRKNNS
jgi:GNAT superfamily N-acetyltransferase